MRKIKFRAWDKERKRMFRVWSLYWYDQAKTAIDFYGIGDREETAVDGEQCVLMQFTCLKDKNGKEIYEGDIVHPTTMHDGNLNLWTMLNGKAIKKKIEICWNDEYAGFEIQLPTNYLEVIGNIYENPELLKASQ